MFVGTCVAWRELGVAEVHPRVPVRVKPTCPVIAVVSPVETAENVTTGVVVATFAPKPPVQTYVMTVPSAIAAACVITMRSAGLALTESVTAPFGAATVAAPLTVHVTEVPSAAAHKPCDAVMLIVSEIAIALLAVTMKVIAVGVTPTALPPVSTAEVHVKDVVVAVTRRERERDRRDEQRRRRVERETKEVRCVKLNQS